MALDTAHKLPSPSTPARFTTEASFLLFQVTVISSAFRHYVFTALRNECYIHYLNSYIVSPTAHFGRHHMCHKTVSNKTCIKDWASKDML